MQVQALSLYLPPCVYVCVAYIREKDYRQNIKAKQTKIIFFFNYYYYQEQKSSQKKKKREKPNSRETSRGHWCSVSPPPAAPQCAEFTHCQWLQKKKPKKNPDIQSTQKQQK